MTGTDDHSTCVSVDPNLKTYKLVKYDFMKLQLGGRKLSLALSEGRKIHLPSSLTIITRFCAGLFIDWEHVALYAKLS